MRSSLRFLSLCFFIASLSSFVVSQPAKDTTKKAEAKWEVSAKHGPSTDVEFETTEGTWMAVDVSPDGKWIVFDLLGDIYSLPVSGGDAKALTSGPAYDVQPRFSPDGKKISFTSDRDGIDNLWIMNADGSKPAQVTKEKERQVNNAVWTPDGQYLIGRKHYRNTRSLGAGEMWLYHTAGGGGCSSPSAVTGNRMRENHASHPTDDISITARMSLPAVPLNTTRIRTT